MRKSCCSPLRNAISCWAGSSVSNSDSSAFEKSKYHSTNFSHIAPPLEKEPKESWEKVEEKTQINAGQ
ncbi:hypothetical protein Aduo_001265 [Ancylostoma duodenale]